MHGVVFEISDKVQTEHGGIPRTERRVWCQDMDGI